jgi:enoyl-CoA hydratase
VTIHAERRGEHVAVVTIDRPERRNAVDHEHVERLHAAIQSAVADRCRVLVVTGASGHFCAGADLTTLEDQSFAVGLRELLDALTHPALVTMAAVDGAALGAGTQLATACDLRIATPAARFGIPAGKLGLMVDKRTVLRVASTVGDSTARAMLLAAEVIDGERAHQLGLAQRLGGLDDALAWADEVAALAPLSSEGHKLGLQSPDDHDAYRKAFDRAWGSADLTEGQAAFREKRSARFEGR